MKTGVLTVIPCLNEANTLIPLLHVLLADPMSGLVVVADGGSDDGSQDIVRAFARINPRVRLLDNPRRKQSAGINLAVAKYGEGFTWLLRVDAHCLYPHRYAASLLAAADRTEAHCVVVPMHTIGRSAFQRGVAAAQNSVLGTGGSPHRSAGEGRFVDHGHHALMRLHLFSKVGGYDEQMRANEDAELDHRMGQAGARIWLEPQCRIEYLPRRSPGALWRQYWHYGKGRAQTVRQHAMRLKLRQALPLAVAPAVAVVPLAALWAWIALPALMWLALCLLGSILLAAKQRSLSAVLAGPAAALMHLAWSGGFWAAFLRGRAIRTKKASDIPPPPANPQDRPPRPHATRPERTTSASAPKAEAAE
ncbi:glycosyltransferase family 2 protein [Aurantiacibacter poecillastricola]|uniref:glycosyltransferase family 2 protein n=1 Tax=Aurantiacibacter poecillastricola TaxID=3064385 RepID=UPI00273F4C75|nr:glycosyltransferase family 2 protein [Aurantiacibacter sp. 219JJ12-13]MDP5263222.1 glycosyltransferase family 2 protein [Aurantiacibacter sp. 219JJ12-13]